MLVPWTAVRTIVALPSRYPYSWTAITQGSVRLERERVLHLFPGIGYNVPERAAV